MERPWSRTSMYNLTSPTLPLPFLVPSNSWSPHSLRAKWIAARQLGKVTRHISLVRAIQFVLLISFSILHFFFSYWIDVSKKVDRMWHGDSNGRQCNFLLDNFDFCVVGSFAKPSAAAKNFNKRKGAYSGDADANYGTLYPVPRTQHSTATATAAAAAGTFGARRRLGRCKPSKYPRLLHLAVEWGTDFFDGAVDWSRLRFVQHKPALKHPHEPLAAASYSSDVVRSSRRKRTTAAAAIVVRPSCFFLNAVLSVEWNSIFVQCRHCIQAVDGLKIGWALVVTLSCRSVRALLCFRAIDHLELDRHGSAGQLFESDSDRPSERRYEECVAGRRDGHGDDGIPFDEHQPRRFARLRTRPAQFGHRPVLCSLLAIVETQPPRVCARRRQPIHLQKDPDDSRRARPSRPHDHLLPKLFGEISRAGQRPVGLFTIPGSIRIAVHA